MTGNDDVESNAGPADHPPSDGVDGALDSVADAIFALNRDWQFTSVGPGVTDLLGRPATELEGELVWEAVPEASDSAFEPRFRTAMQSRSSVDFEAYCSRLGTRVRVWAYPTENGLSVYVRDVGAERQYREQLMAIHETTQELLRAETPGRIAEVAVESSTEILGFPAVALYYWDEEAGVLEPAAASDAVAERYSSGMPTLSGNGSVMWGVFVEGETRSYDESEPPHDEMYEPDTSVQCRVFVPLGSYGVLFACAESSGETVDVAAELLEVLADNVTAALERVERERALVEKDAALERTDERLRELDRVNEIIRKIDQALIRATQRTEVEREICENLADMDAYQLAWFGKLDSQTGEITAGASVGDDAAYLDQLLASTRDERQSTPTEKALRTGEAVFVETILDEASQGKWRKKALDDGYRSIASLPVQFHEVTYGVLEIYADHPRAFSDEERSVLRDLPELIGNALNAIERKEALLADARIELTFRLPEPRFVVSRVATNLDCEVTVRTILPRLDDTWLVYFETADAEPRAVLETARKYPAVDTVEQVRALDGGQLFSFVLTDVSWSDFLAEKGATTTSIDASSEHTDVTVKVPSWINVRSFIDTCKARYPSAELVRRQQVPEESDRVPDGEIGADLTDQQRKALEAAFAAGYFAWPRDATGEEVAESLGVTPPTFHRHLRVSLDKIVAEILE